MYTPNTFGIYVFALWPLLVFWLFKKYTVKEAIFFSIVGSSLLLPVSYVVDYPLIPPIDKDALTPLVIMGVLFIKRERNPIFKPGLWNFFFVAFLFVITISTLLNQDSFELGGMSLPGLTPYDAISAMIGFVLTFIPFFLGRNFFSDIQDTERMYKTLTLTALIYSVFMLYELKWSPHLHETIYGYFPGNFLQQIREGGFRPVVLIGHGLVLAFWFAISTIAALALHQAKVKATKLPSFPIIVYLVIVLVLCKTVSAVIYFIFAAILMYFLKLKKQIMISFALTLLVMVYPINASTQAVKYSDILNSVSEYSVDRANSLKTRFDNEELLISRALKRPFFGWSGWGRSRFYQNGRDITTTDGQWIIVLGVFGVFGFIFYYLMLIYPMFLAIKSFRYIENNKEKIYFSTLTIIVAIGIFDSVPNTGMRPIHFLMVGALLGQAERLIKRKRQQNFEEVRA